MKKSKERIDIEALAVGGSIPFPKEDYMRIARIVTNLNREHRARWLIKPDEICYRIDSDVNPGKVTIIRDI